MGTHHADGGYSSDVRIGLLVGDERYRASHLGPEYIILREVPEDLDVKQATIRLAVDSRIDDFTVSLPDGISPVGKETRYVRVK